MTCLAAAIIDNRAILAADTLITDPVDGSKSHPRDFSKIIEFPHFLIGFAGDCVAYHVLHKLHSEIGSRRRKLKNNQDVYNFTRKFYKEMKDATDIELIIVTRAGKIYKVRDSFVEDCGNMVTGGAGKDLAMGYLRGSNSPNKVEEAVELACELNSFCEGPIHIKEMLIDN